MDLKEEKKVIRLRMKKLRNELDLSLYRKWSSAIMEKCVTLEEWRLAQKVHIYVSAVNNEVDTLGLIFNIWDAGKIAAVPKCEHKIHKLFNLWIRSLDELLPGKFGIMEPAYNPEREISNEELDMVIAPLLAFDRDGGRLGFGMGFYDSLLGECNCPRIGLGYSFQEVDQVPREPHDQKLDIIITEKEIIRVDHE